ncbi:MAG: BLUF domain-containing protein [Brachymonas denitrificans]|jgi:hypothetical protein|uniref:BLUF domain-containing protein n=1 Tax=Brachymonas denitrificans TaxID=28220 RepID=UPI001BCF83F0|nr:BLUF domain-containing protein [Brachymonas denitrificans]
MPLFEILYVSTLAPGHTASVVAPILKVARERNQQQDVTGLLVFNGARFCQQLEGPREQVLAIMRSIEKDERHCDIIMLLQRELPERRFADFRLGYATVSEDDPFEQLQEHSADTCMQQFLQMEKALDLG